MRPWLIWWVALAWFRFSWARLSLQTPTKLALKARKDLQSVPNIRIDLVDLLDEDDVINNNKIGVNITTQHGYVRLKLDYLHDIHQMQSHRRVARIEVKGCM